MSKKIWGTLDPFIEDGAILGRKVANKGFLDALLRTDPFDEYHFFLNTPSTAHFNIYLQDTFPRLAMRKAFRIASQATLPSSLQHYNYHCFHLSDFTERQISVEILRNRYSKNIFPTTGLTHSLSYHSFTKYFLDHMWAGTSPRDAIICTSHSAKATVTRAFASLQKNYAPALDAVSVPQLPCIPLGVDTEHAQAPPSTIATMRRRLGLTGEADPVIFLCLARISSYSKMDFVPVIRAFKKSHSMGFDADRYRFVLAGWVDDEKRLPQALEMVAYSQGVPLSVIPSPSAEECEALYALADVFISPVDNVQETFGLTVLEAGAAGLPAIVSDFDGYKDTIEDGVTGIRIPTLGFQDTTETSDLAFLWGDSQYHLKLAQQVVVSIPKLAKAICLLGTDKVLRLKMGQAARERVVEHYSWDGIIRQYCTLWDTLNTASLTDEALAKLRLAQHPLRTDFAYLFKEHFSATLDTATAATLTLKRTLRGDAIYHKGLPEYMQAGLAYMLDKELLHQLLFCARKPVSGTAVLTELTHYKQVATSTQFSSATPLASAASTALLPPETRTLLAAERAAFTVLWALKHDYIEQV